MALFVCDAMLGELARWFRILGFPALYVPNDWDDDEVLAVLRERAAEAPLLVTRDRRLHRRAEREDRPSLLLAAAAPTEQALRDALGAAGARIEPERLFTLCSLCGAPLRDATPGQVASVPDRVQARQDEFKACTACGQVYWKGTHWQGIQRMVRALST